MPALIDEPGHVGDMTATTEHPLILFDGVCNLCENTVRFIIRRDRDGIFRFASLQSPEASDLMSDLGYTGAALDSVLLVVDGLVYRKSRAALQIAKRLDGAWPLLYFLFFWVPAIVADPIYDFVGNRRYRWFGRKEACWIPTPDLQRRFIDSSPDHGD
jgi:predicted DCC family thiol-disulfide oxidoreductase YuxK